MYHESQIDKIEMVPWDTDDNYKDMDDYSRNEQDKESPEERVEVASEELQRNTFFFEIFFIITYLSLAFQFMLNGWIYSDQTQGNILDSSSWPVVSKIFRDLFSTCNNKFHLWVKLSFLFTIVGIASSMYQNGQRFLDQVEGVGFRGRNAFKCSTTICTILVLTSIFLYSLLYYLNQGLQTWLLSGIFKGLTYLKGVLPEFIGLRLATSSFTLFVFLQLLSIVLGLVIVLISKIIGCYTGCDVLKNHQIGIQIINLVILIFVTWLTLTQKKLLQSKANSKANTSGGINIFSGLKKDVEGFLMSSTIAHPLISIAKDMIHFCLTKRCSLTRSLLRFGHSKHLNWNLLQVFLCFFYNGYLTAWVFFYMFLGCLLNIVDLKIHYIVNSDDEVTNFTSQNYTVTMMGIMGISLMIVVPGLIFFLVGEIIFIIALFWCKCWWVIIPTILCCCCCCFRICCT